MNEWLPKSHTSSLLIVTPKPNPLEIYREHRGTQMAGQVLSEMVWGTEGQVCAGGEKHMKGRLHMKVRGKRTHASPGTQRSGNR